MRKNKIKRILSIVMLTVVTTSLSACGSKKEENVTVHSDVSFPLEETATLTMLTSAPAVSEQNPNNRLIFKRLQEKTNVEVDWTCYPDDQYGDKKSLALSKKDTLPDVVFNAGMSNYDLLRYSKQGVIIAVEDLIDEYMPNLSKILEENQGFVKSMWCGSEECEEKIKDLTGAKSRCMPFEQEHLGDTCPVCGKKADKMVVWGRQY